MRGRGCPRPGRPAARVLPPIRTFTVGPGLPPGQPAAGAWRLGRVADCHRRLGVSPTPEHAFAVVTSVPHQLFRLLRPAARLPGGRGRSTRAWTDVDRLYGARPALAR